MLSLCVNCDLYGYNSQRNETRVFSASAIQHWLVAQPAVAQNFALSSVTRFGKIRHSANILKVLGNSLRIYLVLGKILKLLRPIVLK